MEEASAQAQNAVAGAALEKGESLALDMDSLVQTSEKCSGSPKMTKALSRKGSIRVERRGPEEREPDELSKKLTAKAVCLQVDQFKTEAGEGKCCRRFNRLTGIHPRKILLFFATMSCVGTMILIYCTLAIGRKGGS